MSIVNMTRQAAQPEQEEHQTIKDWGAKRIKKMADLTALMEKMVREIDAIGEDKLERILMMANGNDPDAPKSEATLKVGPHGPGCECGPDDEPEQDCVKH